jgi:DNA-3-methyladenine glycosylase I
MTERCGWPGDDQLYVAYHDTEWGVPLRDGRALFELLILEGAQAGLAWITILRKRDGYRRAFAGFEPELVAAFDADDVARLLADPGIVRNHAKVDAAIGNARAWLSLADATGSPVDHLWSFVDGRPVQNAWQTLDQVPAETDASRAMSRNLRSRGFRFIGPTIAYAFMQSAGMVNDHVTGCFRHAEVAALADAGSA